MDNYLQNIVTKYKEFNEFLDSIDINELKQYSRSSLRELSSEIAKYSSFRYLKSELNKIDQEKKVEEFPELMGVHHYPEIKEIDFLSEEDKIKLDYYVFSNGIGSYMYKIGSLWHRLSKNWSEETIEKVFDFLESKKIIERYYELNMCCNMQVLCQEEVNWYYRLFELEEWKYDSSRQPSKEEFIERETLSERLNWLQYECDDCDKFIDITKEMIDGVVNDPNCRRYKVIKDRNKFYDEL